MAFSGLQYLHECAISSESTQIALVSPSAVGIPAAYRVSQVCGTPALMQVQYNLGPLSVHSQQLCSTVIRMVGILAAYTNAEATAEAMQAAKTVADPNERIVQRL